MRTDRVDGVELSRGVARTARARILGLANAFDVLTLRGQLSPDEAVERLLRETEDGKWDLDVARALEHRL